MAKASQRKQFTIGRSDLCYCGSGRVFRDCCDSTRSSMPVWRYSGQDACAQMIARSGDNNALKSLVVSVSDFFEDRLTLIESARFKNSQIKVDFEHERPNFKSANLLLDVSSERVDCALAHELLHLERIQMGIPTGDTVTYPESYSEQMMVFAETLWRDINNGLCHIPMLPRFLALNLPANKFLVSIPRAKNYTEIAIEPRPGWYPEELDFAWWTAEYFRCWSENLQISRIEMRRAIELIRDLGSKRFSGFSLAVANIEKLVNNANLDDDKDYVECVQALLNVMKLPQFDRFLECKKVAPGKWEAKQIVCLKSY